MTEMFISLVFHVTDVSEVKDIRGTPCYKSDVCPITADLSLTTCEPNSQSCVCQRGYRMDENNYCMGESYRIVYLYSVSPCTTGLKVLFDPS